MQLYKECPDCTKPNTGSEFCETCGDDYVIPATWKDFTGEEVFGDDVIVVVVDPKIPNHKKLCDNGHNFNGMGELFKNLGYKYFIIPKCEG